MAPSEGRVRTATATAVIAAIILVLAFGSPPYFEWVARHASTHTSGGFFLHELAWPHWSFSSDDSLRNLLSEDLRAILVIVLTAGFVTLLAGSQLAGARGTMSQLLAGWSGYIFAAAFAGFLAAFLASHATLLDAFLSGAAGGVYGLFVGWIVGLATLGARK